MLLKLSRILVGSVFLSGVYITQYSPISLQSASLKHLFWLLNTYTPSLTSPTLSLLLSVGALAPYPPLSNAILDSGFDHSATLLSALESIGFKGVRVGPVSYLASQQKEQRITRLGILLVLINILSYRRAAQKQHKPSALQIHLDVCPNWQVLQYAPYLIPKNVLNCVGKISENVDSEVQSVRLHCDYPQFKRQCQASLQVQQILIDTIDHIKNKLPNIPFDVSVGREYKEVIRHCVEQSGVRKVQIQGENYIVRDKALVFDQQIVVKWQQLLDFIINHQQ